jgi:winged helix domain-containing protein
MTSPGLMAIVPLSPEDKRITFHGRVAWALLMLKDAGENGCTPFDHPGPRWSGYVHKLRTVYGIDIETVTETHGGPFAGHHARYVLRSNVEVLHRNDCAGGAVAA